MFENRLKELLKRGQPAIGSWIALSDPYAVEVMAQAGFDWLLIDTEHCPIGTESLRNILIAVKGSRAVPIVRLMNNQPDYFKVALDMGAQGVMVPLIQSEADARRAVDHCRYPPLGSRGFGPVRASKYFTEIDRYVKAANDVTLLIAQIESVQAVENLAAIMSVSGVDAIFVGPTDLASSMNRTGQTTHPDVEKTVYQIMVAARDAGMPFGTLARTPEQLVEYVASGATLVTVGGDLGFLMQGAYGCLERTKSLLEISQSEAVQRGSGE